MKFKSLFVSAVIFQLLTVCIFARPGDLDPSFNGTGTNRVGFGNGMANGQVIALQGDGKYVTAGLCTDGSEPYRLCVTRFLNDGSLDAWFGSAGVVMTRLPGWWEPTKASIVIQPDGKILVGGGFHGANTLLKAILLRYEPNGDLDNSFGDQGIVTDLTSEERDNIAGISLQSDGKIVAAGMAITSQTVKVLVTRLNIDGSIDSSFGNNGTILTGYGAGSGGAAGAVLVQADQKILVASSSATNFVVFRFLPNGSVDTGYGYNGISTVNFNSGTTEPRKMVFQQDGKLLVAGRRTVGDESDFALARLDPSGSPDMTFNNSGRVVTGSPFENEVGNAVAVDHNGLIMVAGTHGDSPNFRAMVVRYRPNGQLDPFFGNRGVLRWDSSRSTSAADIISESNGDLVFSGFSREHSELARGGLAVFRTDSDGHPDAGFGSNGTALAEGANETAESTGMAIQADGKTLLAGGSGAVNLEQATIVRFDQDGSADQGFGINGKVILETPTRNARFNAVEALPDGKILALGSIGFLNLITPYDSFILARFNPDGSLDDQFQGTGYLISELSVGAVAMSIQPDGKIVVLGSAPDTVNILAFRLIRFDENGALDTSFNGQGYKIISFGANYQFPTSLKLQNDGKIVAGGVAGRPTGNGDIVLARVNPNGSLDRSFGPGGFVVTDIANNFDVLAAMAIQPDGKILIGGKTGPSADVHSILIRYWPDGRIDQGFGLGGVSYVSMDGYVQSLALQSDGRILTVIHDNDAEFVVARFLPNGLPDSLDFGVEGFVHITFGTTSGVGRSVGLGNEGEIMVSGTAGGLFGVARLLNN